MYLDEAAISSSMRLSLPWRPDKPQISCLSCCVPGATPVRMRLPLTQARCKSLQNAHARRLVSGPNSAASARLRDPTGSVDRQHGPRGPARSPNHADLAGQARGRAPTCPGTRIPRGSSARPCRNVRNPSAPRYTTRLARWSNSPATLGLREREPSMLDARAALRQADQRTIKRRRGRHERSWP